MIGKLRAPFTSRYVDGAESSLEQAEPTDITLVHRLLHIALACIIREDTTEGALGDMRSPKALLSA